jgi:general secretion pathway protein D
MNLRSISLRSALGLALVFCCGLVGSALAEKGGASVTLNLKDADISTLIATVSEVTGKNFVVDPRVKGKVTVISSSPMDADAVYATFLSVLEVNGFAAIPSGQSIKIVPEANLRTEGGTHVGSAAGLPGDEIVTRVFDIHNGSAAQLMPILRPLVATSGQLAAYASSNSLIVSDRASNVQRLERLIAQIDQNGDRTVEIVHLENAVADDVVKALTSLAQATKQTDPGAVQASVISDIRTNSVLVSGDKAERDKLIALIHQLDQPSTNKGDTQVIYLKYADAQSLAALLMGQPQPSRNSSSNGGSMFGNSSGGRSSFGGSSFGGSGSSMFGTGSTGSTSSTPASATSQSASYGGSSSNNPELRVLADQDTNALVITAPPKIMQQVRLIIAQLDIRRSQVLVEAIIANVSADKSSQLGVDWIAYNPHSIAAAGILNPSTSTALSNIGSEVSSLGTTTTTSLGGSTTAGLAASAASSILGSGATALVGTRSSNGSIYGALIKALASDANTNILSTPSLLTLDNQEAKIEVGQTVPQVTGSYANSGVASVGGVVNPFQTINQQDIGIKLGITPTIGEGDHVRLKLEFEDSSIASGTAGTANLVLNKDTMTDTVTIESGQILVLGGLISDNTTDQVNRIPLLSDIPLLGNLFKARSVDRTRNNLMVFVHPVILRQRDEGDYFTQKKYEYTRQEEINASNGPVPLIGGKPPVLYQYDEYQKKNNLPPEMANRPVPAVGVEAAKAVGATAPATAAPSAPSDVPAPASSSSSSGG